MEQAKQSGSFPLADMQAAPVDIEVRGTTVQVNPVPLSHWAKFDRWMREETMRNALRSADEVGIALRGQVIREAITAASGVSISSPDALKGMLGSIEGMLRLAWTTLRIGGNEHIAENAKAGVTVQDVERLIGNNLNALSAIVEKAVDLSFPKDDDDADTEAPGTSPPADAGASVGEPAPAQ